MYNLLNNPNQKFKNFTNCIVYELAQQFTKESLDPSILASNDPKTTEFNKVLATHCILKKNIKPILSILILASDESFNNMVVIQYIVKPTPLKQPNNSYTHSTLFESEIIWEMGKLFNPKDSIKLYETLYNSNSPRLIESTTLDVFTNVISSRRQDFINKDSRSLSKSAVLFDNKIQKTKDLEEKDKRQSPTTIQPISKGFTIFTENRFQQILNNIRSNQKPSFTLNETNIEFLLHPSKTKVHFDINYVKSTPNTVYNEMLFLSIDPYIILNCFNTIGINFQRLSYSESTQLAKSLSLEELLHSKGLEAHFDIVVLELLNRNIIS